MTTEDLLHQAAACHRAGRFADAERGYRQVLATQPDHPEALQLLGLLAHQAGHAADAVALLERATAVAPNHAGAWNNLGTVRHDDGDLLAAAECYRRAIAARPDYAAAHLNLGESFKDLGDVTAALNCYRESLRHDPNLREARSNYLMTLNYDPAVSQSFIVNESRRWGPIPGADAPFVGHVNRRDPERKLVIGYVSPDIRKHAVARFLEPVLAAHDRDRFEVHLFAEVPKYDAVSERFASLTHGCHRTVLQSAAEVADGVRRLGVDLLIDLAGHTRHNRLDVFAHRPAPVQLTWLGFPNTTGVPEIDYRVCDAVCDPPDLADQATERLLRLPGSVACFAPPANAPDVAPPPCLTRGHLTLGSHHPLIKLNDAVFRLWQRLMAAVPDCRLVMLRSQFTPTVVARYRDRFTELGFDLSRVEFVRPSIDEGDYLDRFRDVDLLLDCFPFTGHTMTCEAMWMGVPVLTRRGDRPAGRLSASVLTAVGLPELIAESDAEYVGIARRLAGEFGRLAEWRSTMRERMRQTVCDGPAFTRGLEAVYRQVWREWCGSRVEVGEPIGDANEQGIALAKAGRFAEAAGAFAEALRRDPTRSAAALNWGMALERTGRIADAERAYERAVRLAPGDAAAHARLAELLQRTGRANEAAVSRGHAERFRGKRSNG